MSKLLRNLAVFEIVLLSGAARMLSSYFPAGPMALAFFLFAVLFFVLERGRIQKRSLFLLLTICSWIYFDQKYLQRQAGGLYITYVLSYGSCFFIISTFTIEDFRKRLLKILQWLSFFSIIVQLAFVSGLIGAKYSSVSELTLSLWFFNMGMGSSGEGERLSSIFWEPGQYQIVLNFVFILCSQDFIELLKNRAIKTFLKRYSILILALILTKSTTGYMVFALIIFYVTINLLSKKHIFSGVAGGILMLIAIFALLQSSTVQEKFDSNSNVNVSYEIRLADNLGLLQMMKEKPWTGYGIGTDDFTMRAWMLDNQTSSNGWFNAGAQIGVPFLILLFICVFTGVKRIFSHTKAWIILFLAVLMAQANEAAYYLAPLCLFIFSFKRKNIRKIIRRPCPNVY